MSLIRTLLLASWSSHVRRNALVLNLWPQLDRSEMDTHLVTYCSWPLLLLLNTSPPKKVNVSNTNCYPKDIGSSIDYPFLVCLRLISILDLLIYLLPLYMPLQGGLGAEPAFPTSRSILHPDSRQDSGRRMKSSRHLQPKHKGVLGGFTCFMPYGSAAPGTLWCGVNR